jgi:hypothetical protein
MSDVMDVAARLLDWIEAAARRRDPRLISLLAKWATSEDEIDGTLLSYALATMLPNPAIESGN